MYENTKFDVILISFLHVKLLAGTYRIIFRYTEDAIERNLSVFGKDNIMTPEDSYEKTRQHLAQSFEKMRNRKGS